MKEGGGRVSFRMMKCETQLAVAGFEDEKGPHQGVGVPLEAGKAGKQTLPQSLQKRTHPCQRLGFDPVRSVSGFGPPDNKCVLS